MSVTRNVFTQGLAQVVQKLLRVLDQLLLVPFFLTAWGAAYYGEWLTLSIIPSVLAFSDLGFGSAVSNGFVLAYARGDKQGAADLRKSGFLIISCSVALGALLTLGVMLVGSEMNLFAKSLIPAGEAIAAVSLMMTSRLISFYNQLVEGFFRGARRAAMGSFFGSGTHLVGLLAGFGVLMCGGGVVGYALSQFVVSVCFTIVYWTIGARLVDLRGYHGRVRRSDVKMITSKGLGYLMSPVWQSIYYQGGTFVVRVVLGAEAVALFNTVRTVCRSVTQLYSMIGGSTFPELQFLYASGEQSSLRRLVRVSFLGAVVLAVGGVAVLLLFGQTLYAWWTRGTLSIPGGVWEVFMLSILLNALWWTMAGLYRVTNQPYHFAVASTLCALLSVGVSYLLAHVWGLLGAVVGTAVFDVIMSAYVLPDSLRLIGMHVGDLFADLRGDTQFLFNKVRYLHRRRKASAAP